MMVGLTDFHGAAPARCRHSQIPGDDRIFIRPAAVEDAAAIRDIMKSSFDKYMQEAGLPHPPGALTESLEDIKSDILSHMVLIAFFNGEPAGSLRLEIYRDEKTAYLKRFGVKPGFNNLGIGKALMNMADCIMEANKIKRLYLHTASNYAELVKFYYDRGFFIESVTTDQGYYRALMVKMYN